ncbi:MAG: hypothetical protein F6J93_33720 [Oscillatoria sp. SIO1A7]|nr:hypothetical protein [Oscillatoria sp. SIO1A7]
MKPIQSNCILKKYIALLLASVILVSLSSCHSNSSGPGLGEQGSGGAGEQGSPMPSGQAKPFGQASPTPTTGSGRTGGQGELGTGRPGDPSSGSGRTGVLGGQGDLGKEDSRSDRKSVLLPKPVEAAASNFAEDSGVEDLGKAKAPSIPSSFPAKPARTSQAANTVSINIYKPDSRCQKLISEPVAVDSEQPIQAAVGKVLAERNTADFSVAGYRVILEPNNGLATIDMRLKPDSPRKFVSLSSCEQFALFGSLRQTLTDNPKWQINTVRFTERGKDIIL